VWRCGGPCRGIAVPAHRIGTAGARESCARPGTGNVPHPAQVQRQHGQHDHLRAEGLGAGHADFGAACSKRPVASRAIELPTTLQSLKSGCPCAWTRATAASVSAVSPDWVMAMTMVLRQSAGCDSEFRAYSTSTECGQTPRTGTRPPGPHGSWLPQAVRIRRSARRSCWVSRLSPPNGHWHPPRPGGAHGILQRWLFVDLLSM